METEKFYAKAVRYMLSIGAVAAFALALYEAYSDKVSSAAVCAGLFAFCCLFAYAPVLESFKGFGLEARFNRKVEEFNKIIIKLRELSLAFAGQAYAELGAQGGNPGTTLDDYSNLASAINNVLIDLDVSKSDLKRVQSPFVRRIGIGLSHRISQMLQSKMAEYQENNKMSLAEALEKHGGSSDEYQTEYKRFNERRILLSQMHMAPDLLFNRSTPETFAGIFTDAIPVYLLEKPDCSALKAFIKRSAKAYSESVKAGNYSADALYLLKHHAPAALQAEVFGSKIK